MRVEVGAFFGVILLVGSWSSPAPAADVRQTDSYRRLRAVLEAVRAIDTHDHLWPFDRLPGYEETELGYGMSLSGLWRSSYFPGVHSLPARAKDESFSAWWSRAKPAFADACATGVYRYQLPAFRDLYGVDFERLTDREAGDLDRRVFSNYRNPAWLCQVVTEKARIELMFNDPYWDRLSFSTFYPFEVLVFNVTALVMGFHPAEFGSPSDDPYAFAQEHGMKVESLDDYLRLLEALFRKAKAQGAACLKTTLAYQRTLNFENVPKARAERAFGRVRKDLTRDEIRDFEDYIMWRLVELSAKYDLPFQIHTGHGRLQGSSPMNLLDLIEANPRTKFILFHGGFPWVDETGAIAMRHVNHVWIDSVWLPTLSPTLARRALHVWLEMVPSSRILWGADCNHAEGIYGATVVTRDTLAEVLAEKVERGELSLPSAERIGRQILRENALALFPSVASRLEPAKAAVRKKDQNPVN
jgi:hypothetical protein